MPRPASFACLRASMPQSLVTTTSCAGASCQHLAACVRALLAGLLLRFRPQGKGRREPLVCCASPYRACFLLLRRPWRLRYATHRPMPIPPHHRVVRIALWRMCPHIAESLSLALLPFHSLPSCRAGGTLSWRRARTGSSSPPSRCGRRRRGCRRWRPTTTRASRAWWSRLGWRGKGGWVGDRGFQETGLCGPWGRRWSTLRVGGESYG